jgi:prepilin-type N-terminal cleavage/methylation domain-containing protein
MRRSPGFTLVEVLVALAVGGMVVLAAYRLFAAVLDGLERLDGARQELDRQANARFLLSRLAGSGEAGPGDDAFVGESDRVAFTSWHVDSAGRTVRWRVRILTQGEWLILEGGPGEPVNLLDGITGLAAEYLLDQGAEERFVGEWRSEAGAPAAIRLRLNRRGAADTLLLIVGRRG